MSLYRILELCLVFWDFVLCLDVSPPQSVYPPNLSSPLPPLPPGPCTHSMARPPCVKLFLSLRLNEGIDMGLGGKTSSALSKFYRNTYVSFYLICYVFEPIWYLGLDSPTCGVPGRNSFSAICFLCVDVSTQICVGY